MRNGKKLHEDFLNNRVICAILHAVYDLAKYKGMQNVSQRKIKGKQTDKMII